MDGLNIKSTMLTNIISKLLTSVLKKKIGANLDLNIDSICVTVNEGRVNFDLKGSTSLSGVEELIKKSI